MTSPGRWRAVVVTRTGGGVNASGPHSRRMRPRGLRNCTTLPDFHLGERRGRRPVPPRATSPKRRVLTLLPIASGSNDSSCSRTGAAVCRPSPWALYLSSPRRWGVASWGVTAWALEISVCARESPDDWGLGTPRMANRCYDIGAHRTATHRTRLTEAFIRRSSCGERAAEFEAAARRLDADYSRSLNSPRDAGRVPLHREEADDRWPVVAGKWRAVPGNAPSRGAGRRYAQSIAARRWKADGGGGGGGPSLRR